MNVNKKLLPIKGHYFLFNAGTAPLVPYLSTYARQLGFSSATVGLIYTILPIFGLVAKPLFGVIADRFKIQKSLFIFFQIVTLISFSLIYAIPENKESISVELDCNGGFTVIKSCYAENQQADRCKIGSLEKLNGTVSCRMNCKMTTPKMWQTVCEHWHLPEYCYSNTDNIKYKAAVNNATMEHECAYIEANNVTLDDKYTYIPNCHIGDGYVDINEPCTLDCTNKNLSAAIGNHRANMTCVNKMLNYRLCYNDTSKLAELAKGNTKSECSASCDLDKQSPWRLMEICEGWGADVASTCHPRTAAGHHFPSNLSFEGVIKPSTTLLEHECVYIQMKKIRLPDNTTHIPYCKDKVLYENTSGIFNTSCEITCDENPVVNEILEGAQESHASKSSQYTTQFWLFFLMMIISWIGQAVVVTFADAICFNLLGNAAAQYGKQRLWGSVGFGLFSLLTGVLIDHFSEGTYKNYAIAFILMFVFMLGDVVVSCFIKTESTKMSINILGDVGALMCSVHTVIFLVWTIAVGLSTGLLWQFLFWHLEDISELGCDGSDYIKTLQGLVSAIQTFLGEIPFMFLSGFILRKLGHVNMMSLVLFAFGVRFILYSFLTNAWWVLPIEMLQGVTFGMFYPTMTSYANVVSPPGTETTVQGLVGAVFEGVGVSLGSFIGGQLYKSYGGWQTFQWFGIASLVFCSLHIVAQILVKNKHTHTGLAQGYSSVIRYEQPNDMVFILEDVADEQ